MNRVKISIDLFEVKPSTNTIVGIVGNLFRIDSYYCSSALVDDVMHDFLSIDSCTVFSVQDVIDIIRSICSLIGVDYISIKINDVLYMVYSDN